jgi:hypothetical protein
VTVAALYVDPHGVYAGLPDVDLWDEGRDARLYAGPWPVVAHPPCGRWSRLAGLVQHRWGHRVGDDDGCFAAALRAVQNFGGVLEHPAFSKAWDAFGLPKPLTYHGWTAGICGGWSCYVEQGQYGLWIAKPTWLYAYGVELPELVWGGSWHARYEPGYISESGKGQDGWSGRRTGKRAGKQLGLTPTTPPAFRDVLLKMACTAHVKAAA